MAAGRTPAAIFPVGLKVVAAEPKGELPPLFKKGKPLTVFSSTRMVQNVIFVTII